MYNPIKDKQYLFSTYVPPDNNAYGHDAVIVSLLDSNTNEPSLHIIENPDVQIYVTRDGLRTYKYKKEYEPIQNLDMYICPYKEMFDRYGEILNMRRFEPNQISRFVARSPYCYGWDIDITTKVKLEYTESCSKPIGHISKGALDIETSVLGDNQIICASVAVWDRREVHCFILETWLSNKTGETIIELNKRTEQEYAQFADGLNDIAKAIWDKQPPTVKYHFCKDEKTLLKMLLACINYFKINAIGIWNMEYDIPYIMRRAEFRQLDLAELFCHKDVPAKYRYFKWNEDRSKPDHFSETWHTVSCPGYTFYYDAMCLYSRLRKVKGKEISYTLDYIGNKIVGTGKMKFGTGATHYEMQTNDKIGYCVYNTLDTVLPMLMDDVTGDVLSMLMLLGPSEIGDFNKQTVQLKNQFYVYLLENKCIPGSVRGSIALDTDKYIGNIGGAVLNPILMREKGLACLKESNVTSSIYKDVCDLDVSSFYPSITIAFNVSKETKLGTVLYMDGCPYTLKEIEKASSNDIRKEMTVANAEYICRYFGRITCVEENAIAICHEYFNLPNYSEMLSLFQSSILRPCT